MDTGLTGKHTGLTGKDSGLRSKHTGFTGKDSGGNTAMNGILPSLTGQNKTNQGYFTLQRTTTLHYSKVKSMGARDKCRGFLQRTPQETWR